uniref:Uncharacterized protein n=1 Tax=Sarcophilus harrisii TaxID=9305 RepID=A0A7N4NQI8_SARHA
MQGTENKKMSFQLFTLIHKALVTQLCKEYKKRLRWKQTTEKKGRGYNSDVRFKILGIGQILIGTMTLENSDVIANVASKMCLGITNCSLASDEFSLILENNPLVKCVGLLDNNASLIYSNLLCGMLRGILKMVQMAVEG